MISYVTIGASDLEKSLSFYETLLSDLGVKRLISMDRIVFLGRSSKEPMLAVCIPYNEEPVHPGNGTMVTFSPGSKEAVDEHYRKALSLGAISDGEPGQRVPDVFYGAYVRDFDGNKVCFCHFG